MQFHDCPHGFVVGRGCGTAGLKAKLVQQLAYMEHNTLYLVFIDLQKAYNDMDRNRCIKILWAYRVEPNMIRLLKYFWDEAILV